MPDGGLHKVPLADIAVLLIGSKAVINSSVLHHLASHDVTTLVCDWRGVPQVGLYPWSEHTRVGARHLAQATVSKPRLKNAWMQLVRAKIRGQATTLHTVDDLAADHLRYLARRVMSGDPKNIEATAARWYWSQLFDNPDFMRSPSGTDIRNGLLDYGYGVVRGFGIRAVTSAGLNPALGVFHKNRSIFFNLVEDLIEPFRPAIDAKVLELGPEASLENRATKHELVDAAMASFTDGTGILAEFENLAQRFGQYVEGDIDRLHVTAWQPSVLYDHA